MAEDMGPMALKALNSQIEESNKLRSELEEKSRLLESVTEERDTIRKGFDECHAIHEKDAAEIERLKADALREFSKLAAVTGMLDVAKLQVREAKDLFAGLYCVESKGDFVTLSCNAQTWQKIADFEDTETRVCAHEPDPSSPGYGTKLCKLCGERFRQDDTEKRKDVCLSMSPSGVACIHLAGHTGPHNGEGSQWPPEQGFPVEA